MPAPAEETNQELGAALGLIPSGLFILTLRHGTQATGLLLSWIQQCAFEPPRVSFCLKSDRYHLDWLRAGAAATLHIVSEEKGKPLLKQFGGGFDADEDAFGGMNVNWEDGRAPRLPEVLAWLDVRADLFVPTGDHVLVVCEAMAGGVQDPGKPWVHIRKSGLNY